METVWATIHKAGGLVTWVAIVLSFFVTEMFSKWKSYQLQGLSKSAAGGAETGDSSV